MNAVFRLFISRSLSGGLLILVLFLGKRLWRDRFSRQWQYYIWLPVVLRLLIPLGLEARLPERVCQTAEEVVSQAALPWERFSAPVAAGAARPEPEGGEAPAPRLFGRALPAERLGWIWLAAAAGLLIRRITAYQSFLRYLRTGAVPVSDAALLDRLSVIAERAGVKRPVELWVHPMLSSPILTGFFRPCIVLPGADLGERDFQYTALHELIHYRRRDLAYKWLVQAAVCLHWFNPLVHLMSREITRACEFSCDEAVLAAMGEGAARDYGETLLNAMAAVGRPRKAPGAVTLSENKQLLKERLGAIMRFKRKSPAVRFLTLATTLCVLAGAVFAGVSPAAAAGGKPPAGMAVRAGGDPLPAEKAYQAGSLPLFQIAFSRLDKDAQGAWLNRIYADQDIAFMGAAVNLLDEDCDQLLRLAETVYRDGDLAFFSNLTARMSRKTLEAWLDRALEDGSWAFQSTLSDALDRCTESDGPEAEKRREWEAARTAEYEAVGVTVDGKDYYYQGELVNVFLDLRSDKAFYTLNMNPRGTVNIKILRNSANAVTGVGGLTEAELEELFGGGEDGDGTETVPVNLKAVDSGALVDLGTYDLSPGDRVQYDVTAGTGRGMQLCFARDQNRDPVFWSVHSLRQPGETLRCAAEFTVEPSQGPGRYRLYLRAPDGALGDVRGWVSIAAE